MNSTTTQIIDSLLRVAPDLVGQLISRLKGADPQTRENMLQEMHTRVFEMRKDIDSQMAIKFPGDERE